MKYRKIISPALFCVVSALISVSCTNWLEVDPEDQILAKQIYSTEQSINIASNGLYLKMGNGNLYGSQFTSLAAEILGQQYGNYASWGPSNYGDERKRWYYMGEYDYTNKYALQRILSMWTTAYNFILDVNLFMKEVDETEGILSQPKKDMLLGEAYAMRAFVHLDLLRLFGPVYAVDSTRISIPYYTNPDGVKSERLPANQVMGRIISDLDRSLELLQNDPVRTLGANGPEGTAEETVVREVDYYSNFRNQRLNYFAVQALKARALLYRQNREEAGLLAASVIDQSEMPDLFDWTTAQEINDYSYPDRLFYKEMLFGVYYSDVYKNWDDYFNPALLERRAMVVHRSAVTDLFPPDYSSSSDLRSMWWEVYPSNSDFLALNKFRRPSGNASDNLYVVPLIRKSELYYIAAEGLGDVSYLNQVRTNRGISPLPNDENLQEELLKEYRREMYGEGQVFYFYKRNNYTQIPRGENPGANVTMGADKYILPLPQSELDY